MSNGRDRATDVLQGGAGDVRVFVVGNSGAGKSTFAKQLAYQLEHVHFELDELYWGPNWTPNEDFHRRVATAAAGENWVTDGGYSVIRHILWPRLTTVIWLDYPFYIVFWRSLRRALRRAWTQEEMWAGNRESWARLFSRDSILLFAIKTFRGKRRSFTALRAANTYPQLNWIHLRHPSEAERLLQYVSSDASNDGDFPSLVKADDLRSYFEANEKWPV